jgi:class 3 adenylate cyclase
MGITSISAPGIAWAAGLIDNLSAITVLSFQAPFTVLSAWMLFRARGTNTLRYGVLISQIVAQIFWTLGAVADLSDGSGRIGYGVLWISYVFVSNILLPFRAFVHMPMFAFYFVSTSVPIYFYPDNVYGIGATLIALLVGQNAQLISHRAFKNGLMTKFREQSRYIPQQVLLQSARENQSIEKVFGPKVRFCVCICSDWRNFQELADGVSPDQLGSYLSSYYERVVERLRKDLPEGNYFMDWIADELFVVIFAADENPDPKIVDAGFDFGAWLLSHRRTFARETGFPKGIDVGISSGLASVGIFGPSGSGKATAFGSIPGASRRLQTLAKQFRGEYGDQDRLVLSGATAELIDADHAQCSRVELTERYAAKDLKDNYFRLQFFRLVQFNMCGSSLSI